MSCTLLVHLRTKHWAAYEHCTYAYTPARGLGFPSRSVQTSMASREVSSVFLPEGSAIVLDAAQLICPLHANWPSATQSKYEASGAVAIGTAVVAVACHVYLEAETGELPCRK